MEHRDEEGYREDEEGDERKWKMSSLRYVVLLKLISLNFDLSKKDIV